MDTSKNINLAKGYVPEVKTVSALVLTQHRVSSQKGVKLTTLVASKLSKVKFKSDDLHSAGQHNNVDHRGVSYVPNEKPLRTLAFVCSGP